MDVSWKGGKMEGLCVGINEIAQNLWAGDRVLHD